MGERGHPCPNKHTRHQPDAKGQRNAALGHQGHQRIGRRPGKGDRADRHQGKAIGRDHRGDGPAHSHSAPDHKRAQQDALGQITPPRKGKRACQGTKSHNSRSTIAQPQIGQKATPRPTLHRPKRRDPFAQRCQDPGKGRLRHQRHDQPRDQRAQVARGRQDQKPRGTAARQDHADAEHQPTDQRARNRPLRRQLPRARHIEQAQGQPCLRQRHGGEEGDQPNGEFRAELAARHLGRGRAQAETRALRGKAEHQPRHHTGSGQHKRLAPGDQ